MAPASWRRSSGPRSYIFLLVQAFDVTPPTCLTNDIKPCLDPTPEKIKTLVSHLGEQIKKACVSRNQVCVPCAGGFILRAQVRDEGLVLENRLLDGGQQRSDASVTLPLTGGRVEGSPSSDGAGTAIPMRNILNRPRGFCLRFDPTRLDQCVHYNRFILLFIHCRKVMW